MAPKSPSSPPVPEEVPRDEEQRRPSTSHQRSVRDQSPGGPTPLTSPLNHPLPGRPNVSLPPTPLPQKGPQKAKRRKHDDQNDIQLCLINIDKHREEMEERQAK